MKLYTFQAYLSGWGDFPEEAWADVLHEITDRIDPLEEMPTTWSAEEPHGEKPEWMRPRSVYE